MLRAAAAAAPACNSARELSLEIVRQRSSIRGSDARDATPNKEWRETVRRRASTLFAKPSAVGCSGIATCRGLPVVAGASHNFDPRPIAYEHLEKRLYLGCARLDSDFRAGGIDRLK